MTTQATTRSQRRWPRLSLILVVNAMLQALLVIGSPWGTDAMAWLAALGSAVVMVGAALLAARTLRAGHSRRGIASTIATHPWRFAVAVFGALLIGAACWIIALVCVAFLPGLLAILTAWLLIGALACLPIAWWVRLSQVDA